MLCLTLCILRSLKPWQQSSWTHHKPRAQLQVVGFTTDLKHGRDLHSCRTETGTQWSYSLGILSWQQDYLLMCDVNTIFFISLKLLWTSKIFLSWFNLFHTVWQFSLNKIPLACWSCADVEKNILLSSTVLLGVCHFTGLTGSWWFCCSFFSCEPCMSSP